MTILTSYALAAKVKQILNLEESRVQTYMPAGTNSVRVMLTNGDQIKFTMTGETNWTCEYTANPR